MTPGSKWHTIQNEGSINALNNRYGKSVSTRVSTTTTVKPVKFDDINSDFMAKTEEDAIKKLTEKYGKLGFEFSEEGLFAIDRIRVKTKDGSKDQVFEFDEKNPEQARELRAFLEVNATKSYSENFDKALNSLNKFEGKDQMSGPKMGTGQYGYQQQSAIVRGKNLLSNEFQLEFKKLPFEEQKEIIQEQIIGTGLPTNDIQSFYKSAAYQDYKKKKVGGDQQSKSKQDQIYDDYQYALATKDPAKIKEAKAKIDAYYTDDIIQDNVKTYNMKLNDFEQSQKNILQDRKAYDDEVNRFNELDESGNMTQEQYDAQKKILDDKAESLETRAQNFVMQRKEIQASQNKLNLVAGKYIAAKEKEGNIGGFLVNKVLTGVSMTFAEPFAVLEATGQNFYDQLSPEEKAYYKSIQHNGKNLTREQIENLLANKAALKAKTEAKESIIKTLGKEGTTLEYMKSGDRGFITQAIGGVLESLPAMATGVAGKAAGFVGLAAQAYSGIEEEMLSDPDFQYTSAGDRAIIAIPYAAGMGVLESVGLQNLVKGDSFLGKVMMDVALKSAKKLGANATKEALERVAAKEVESLLAKGLIRVTQAGVAEFETGFTQALVLDQGLKNVYNYIQQSGLTEEQKKNLTQGEYFDTADGFKELASQTFEDGVAEMIGGFTMGSVGTVLQAVVNGNISLYNEDDVKFLNDVVADSNFKKLYVASMKTQMLNGNITKSKAQQNLNNLNEIEAAFDMMPDGLSTADMNTSLSLITERAQLTREKAGKDPNLVAPLEARIKAINEELTKIGENAVQEQATSEVSVQPGAKGGREVAQGKPEAGLKETTKKGKEEVDQYIADMGAEARIGNTINPVMEKMANAEYINDNDIDNAIEAIFNEVESLDKSDYSAETKAALSEKLLNIAEKLDNYEFRTKTETVATTKAGAATTTRRTSEAVQKIRAEKYFDGVQATVNGQEVTLTDNKGRVEAQMPNGEVVVLDTPTMEIAEDGFEFDDNGALQAVTVTDRLGNTAKLTGDQALDFAIRDRENKLGVVEQAEFDTVYQEVEKKYIKETPTTQVAAEEQAAVEEQQPVVEEEAVVEEEKQPVKEPSEANRFTERNAKVMAVKFPSKKGIVRAALNIIKALPGVKIYLHEDSDQYTQELAARTGQKKQFIINQMAAGAYIDGEIHINMSRANVVTLLHEAFHHAFLTLGVKNGMFIDLAKGLRSLVTDKATLAELDEFIKVYYSDFDQNKLDKKIKEFKLANPLLSKEEIEKEVNKITEEFESEIDDETLIERAEEFAVQLGAILANNREELTTTKLTQFKALINRIAKKIGLGMVFSSAANSKEAADFINTITRGLTTGDIVEGKFKPTKTGKAKRQAVTIMEGKESMKKFGLAPGKNVTRKIGEALEARQRAKYGTIAQKDNSPEARKKISNWMVDEVKYFVQLMGDKSGKGWYGELYQNSLDAMAKVFPEMKTDQNARDLFTMLVAITSDGQKVMSNFRLAAAAYDYYKKNGVMPNTLPGQRVASFEANLKRINELLVEYNGDIATIKEKLMEVKSIEEINKERRREGLEPLSTNWPVSFKAPFAASVFGPKLGMFYSNLSGNESYPTLDRWWSRTFNRYRGTLIPGLKSGFSAKGEAIGLDRFKQLLGNPGMSNEEALLAAKSYRDSYAAKGYKSGTDVEKAANTIYKTAFENLNDAPFTKNDRQFMYDTISDAVNKLNKQGYDLSIADVQAILWYFEKNLYKTLGVQAKIEGISYEDAANYTYNKWKESGNKFDYKINESEEGQAVEDADEDIEEEKKSIKFQKDNKKTPNLAQNETGRIQPQRTGDGRTARSAISKNAPLEGAPTIQGATGPDPGLVSVAEKYADENDIDLKRQGEYVELDEQRAKRIADAYEQMADDPQNPKVKEAYAELIKQTKAQYQALIDAGYKFWFVDVKNPDNIDYISSPYNAMRDLRQNKQMGVFPTEQGFGSNEDMDVSKNPLLEDTGIMWPSGGLDGEMKIVTANDLFRAVHDTFGHGLEGAGFRARGEENAWQSHSRLYTGSAIGAMTSETRGQNSWVNYGPKGEQNRTASGEDTIFADQKVGLMPKWTWTEGRAGDMEAPKKIKFQKTPKQNWNPTPVKNMNESPIAKNSDKVRNAAIDLIKGKIDQEDYTKTVEKYSPIGSIGTLFAPATTEHMELALGKKADKLMAPVVDENGNKLKKVGTRLDIPSYLNKNAWVVTVHDERIKNGPVVSYRNAVRLKNVEFSTDPRMALNIAAGLMGKSTFARMVGEMVDIPGPTAEEQGLNAQVMVEEIMNDPNWIQVGMNPFRHSFFWNRANGMPVVSADEVIQIGGLVYAKNAKEVSPNSDQFTVYGKYDESKNKVVASDEPMLDKSGKKIKFQKAPKILGVKPTVVIVNDEQKALVDQIKLEVRAQREQKKAYKQVLADISARVTALKSKGNISVKQFDAIMKNLKRLNFDNETKVQAFIDYVSRALANADYVEKVAKAQSLNKRIKASLKGTANPFAVLAKMFTTLDSRWVQNIDDHIAVAQMILDGVKPSTARRGVLTLKEEPDLQVIAEYIDAEQTLQTKMLLDNLKARYERITGKPSASLDAETMLTELQGLNPTVDQTDNIKQQIDEKLAEYAEMLTDEDPQVIVDAINIDTDIMDWKDAVKILDSLDTYFTNGSLAGIESLVGAYKGIQNVKKFRSKSKPMSIAMSKKLGSTRLGLFAGFSRILERKFRSTEKANMYQNASGINDIITGANRADFEAAKKQKEYIKKFEKVKDFYSNENIYERGVIADLIRTNPGIDQDAEFERLVNILMDSKDMLLASKDNVKVEMGKTYDQVFKKLGLYDADADIESVKAKATKTNIDAVNFVVDMFAEKYDLLSDTAMGVYNIMLGQDINYTPKTYVNDKTTKSKDSDPLGGNDVLGLGAYTNASFNRNEAGVLMPITRPKDIKSNGKYVDLNFDNNMFRSYRLALTDAYTATGIRQLNSFYNSKENEDIIGSEKDFDIIKEALADYINTIKGKHLIDKNLLQGVDKWLNMVSTFGAVRALVGIGQAANQFASGMSNTIVNAGEHIRPSDFTKKAFDFMNRSGQPIANVGENDILISLANFDKSIERATFGKSIAEVGLDKFAKFNAKAFQMMVSNPDAVARRLAWMAYYRKYAIKNKLGPIDFNAEPNVEAAAYAQSMVDRSMDTTDARVRGEVYRSQNTATKILRSVFIPFSSFGMNQRTRMWGDLTKLVTGDANLDTARSLASITAEIYVYNMIRFQMARLILWSAMNLLGYDEEEQDELIEKMKRNMLASSWSKAIVDVVSPLALADNYVLKLSNWVMSSAGIGEPDKKEIDDYIKEENDIRKVKNLDPLNAEQEKKKREDFMKENSMQFYISDEANFGTLGIQWEKMSEAYDILAALKTGKYTNERKQDKYFDKEGMSKLESVALLKMGGVIAPVREFDQIANKSFKLLKDSNTMSEKKNDMIGEVKKKFGKLDPVLEKLAEKKNKLTSIEDEINWINSKERKGGGFGLKGSKEKEEYAKLLDVISQPSADMLKMIQNGKTAQYIIDQELKK
jgi:hypothetical protein